MSLRLFVAVEPTREVRDEAERAARHLRQSLPSLRARFTSAATIHLTLAFLGEVAETELEPLRTTLAGLGATARPFGCATGGLGAFPSGRRPSVLWLGIRDATGRLAELQHELTEALAKLGSGAGDPRFVPHLTLARVATLGGTDRSAVEAALASFEPGAATWPVEALTLFRSELGKGGARHTVVFRAPLSAPARDGSGRSPW